MTWYEEAMQGDPDAIALLWGEDRRDHWITLLQGIEDGQRPSLAFIEALISNNDDPGRWFQEVMQAAHSVHQDDTTARLSLESKSRNWLRIATIAFDGETCRPAMIMRLLEVRSDPAPQDAGHEQAGTLVLDALNENMRDIGAEALLLSAKANFFLGAYEEAQADTRQAMALFDELGNGERMDFAARGLAAALMHSFQWEESLAVYAEVLQSRGPLFSSAGKTFLRPVDDPVEDAIGQLRTIGMWASEETPEWTMALGALAQRLAESSRDGVELLQEQYESSLEGFEATEEGVDGLHVVVRLLDERLLHAASMEASTHLIEICDELYGPEANDTMIARNLFAAAARRGGENELAEPHYRQVSEALIKAEAPEAFGVLSNWASCLTDLGRHDDALDVLTQALSRADTPAERWGTRAQMVPVLPEAVAKDLAQALYEEVRDQGELASQAGAAAVDAYLSVLLAANDEAAIRVQEALWSAALTKEDGPKAWLEEHNLGAVYAELGQRNKAREIFERVLATQQKGLWAEHPHIALTLRSLARVTQQTH